MKQFLFFFLIISSLVSFSLMGMEGRDKGDRGNPYKSVPSVPGEGDVELAELHGQEVLDDQLNKSRDLQELRAMRTELTGLREMLEERFNRSFCTKAKQLASSCNPGIKKVCMCIGWSLVIIGTIAALIGLPDHLMMSCYQEKLQGASDLLSDDYDPQCASFAQAILEDCPTHIH